MKVRIKGKTIAKWISVVLALGIIGVGGFYGYRYFTAEDAVTAVQQATARVSRGDIAVNVTGTGSIEPVSQKTVVAGSNAEIEQVLVQQGDIVKQGDTLVIFSSESNTNQIRTKELEKKKALIDLEQLQENYKTADEEAQKAIALNIEKQQLSLELLEEELEELRSEQEPLQVTSPIDGKITTMDIQAGEQVNANTVIAEIVDYSKLQVTVAIDELDIPKVEIGQDAVISVEAFSEETFKGVVKEIADQGNSSNGVASFGVTVLIDEPGSIKSGMSAEASIMVDQKSDVLLLPIDAVQSMGNRYYVTVSSAATSSVGQAPAAASPIGQPPAVTPDSNPELPARTDRAPRAFADPSGNSRVFVEVGLHNEDYIEIVSGLNEGDSVILPSAAAASSNDQMMFPMGGFSGMGGQMPSGLPSGMPSGPPSGTGSPFGSGGRR